MKSVLLILLAIILILNVRATLVLARSAYYEARQKLLQLVLVWLLPIVGAYLVLSLAAEPKSERFTTDLQNHGGYDDGDIHLGDSSFDGGGGGGDGGGGD